MKRKIDKSAIVAAILLFISIGIISYSLFKITIYGWITEQQYSLTWLGFGINMISIWMLFNAWDYLLYKKDLANKMDLAKSHKIK